jgi:hypothetical protein
MLALLLKTRLVQFHPSEQQTGAPSTQQTPGSEDTLTMLGRKAMNCFSFRTKHPFNRSGRSPK